MATEIRLLGSFRVVVDGQEVPAGSWSRRQGAALVKLLALSERHRLHREQVIAQLWPGLSTGEAAPRLHKAAHFARKALSAGEVNVSMRDEIVALEPADEVVVDVDEFRVLARQALANSDAALADRALELYADDLLPDDLYEEWCLDARDGLRELRRALLRLTGRWSELADLDPSDEEAQLRVARKLAEEGDHRGALRRIERLERALHRELGGDLTPDARALKLRLEAPGADPGRRPDTNQSAAAASAPARARVRLIGRREVVDRLRGRIAEASDGRGGAMLLRGRAGVGKTALLDFAEALANKHEFRIARWAASSVEGRWPYGPVMAALGRLCRAHPALLDGLGDRFREEIETAMAADALAWSGEPSHSRLFVATAELIRLAAAGGGLLLVIDDVHESDDASLRLLHYLARCAQDQPILILLAGRAGSTDDLVMGVVGLDRDSVIPIEPLAAQTTAKLVADLHPDMPASTVAAIAEASAGIPFTALELARRQGSSPTGQPYPVISTGAVQTLRRLALLGTTFMTDEFLAMSDAATDAAYRELGEALDASVIEQSESGYRFRHPMLRDSIVDSIPVHQLASEQYEVSQRLGDLDAQPARVASLLIAASRPAQAVPYVVRAVESAGAVGAYRDALELLDGVIDHASPADRATLLARRGDLLMAIGSPDSVSAYRAALSATTGTEHRLVRARLARVLTFAGDLDSASAALGDQEPEGDAADAPILLTRAMIAYFRGDLDSAWRITELARERVDLGDSGWQIFDLVAFQGLLAHHRGEGFDRFQLELRRTSGREALATIVFDAHLCVAEYVLYGNEAYDDVIVDAEALRTAAHEAGARRGAAFATALIGEAALLKGDLRTAERELGDAIAMHREIGAIAGEAHSMQRLAEALLARGAAADAMDMLRRALRLARWSVMSPHLLQRIFGGMITASPDAAAARAVVDQAVTTMTDCDRCILCDVMFAIPAAIACARVGDVDEAARHLRNAEASAAHFDGDAWNAAVIEARAAIALAEERGDDARLLLDEAAERFAAAGQLGDADRCRRALANA